MYNSVQECGGPLKINISQEMIQETRRSSSRYKMFLEEGKKKNQGSEDSEEKAAKKRKFELLLESVTKQLDEVTHREAKDHAA